MTKPTKVSRIAKQALKSLADDKIIKTCTFNRRAKRTQKSEVIAVLGHGSYSKDMGAAAAADAVTNKGFITFDMANADKYPLSAFVDTAMKNKPGATLLVLNFDRAARDDQQRILQAIDKATMTGPHAFPIDKDEPSYTLPMPKTVILESSLSQKNFAKLIDKTEKPIAFTALTFPTIKSKLIGHTA